jgi:hypothetical protein
MTYDGELLYATTSGPNGIMDVIDLDVFTILKTGESPYNQSSSGAPNLLIRRADSMQDELVATTKLRMYKYDANIPDGYSGISGYGYSGYSGDSGTSGT